MHKQTTLFDDNGDGGSIEERFAVFVSGNQWFVDECIRLAREHKASGNRRWSMKAIFELNRPRFRRDGSRRYGLNNIYTAPMARLVMERAPDLEGFFELR